MRPHERIGANTNANKPNKGECVWHEHHHSRPMSANPLSSPTIQTLSPRVNSFLAGPVLPCPAPAHFNPAGIPSRKGVIRMLTAAPPPPPSTTISHPVCFRPSIAIPFFLFPFPLPPPSHQSLSSRVRFCPPELTYIHTTHTHIYAPHRNAPQRACGT